MQFISTGTYAAGSSSIALNTTESSCPTANAGGPSTLGYAFEGQGVVFIEATGTVDGPYEPLPVGSVTLGTGLTITTGCLALSGVFMPEAIVPVPVPDAGS